MHEGIVFAGFGGQGIILSGMILCLAAMEEGKQVSHIPSYGAEMRGGTANCAVVVSDAPVGSPLVARPDAVIIMNRPSLEKFEAALKPGGLLVINSSLCDREPSRRDVKVIRVAATDLANDLGDIRVANMVALGAFLAACPVVRPDSIVDALKKNLPPHHQKLIPLNKLALERGAEAAAGQL